MALVQHWYWRARGCCQMFCNLVGVVGWLLPHARDVYYCAQGRVQRFGLFQLTPARFTQPVLEPGGDLGRAIYRQASCRCSQLGQEWRGNLPARLQPPPPALQLGTPAHGTWSHGT